MLHIACYKICVIGYPFLHSNFIEHSVFWVWQFYFNVLMINENGNSSNELDHFINIIF